MAGAVVLTLILAQAPAPATADADQLARIRRALAETPAIDLESRRAEGPVFRVTIYGRKPDQPVWATWSAAPPNVRPWFKSYHHEFLEQVTVEQFRGPTLYPVGVPVLQVVEFMVNQISALKRKRDNANAKIEVRQALEEFLACRANPERPGCS
jgi:hypothetical protein